MELGETDFVEIMFIHSKTIKIHRSNPIWKKDLFVIFVFLCIHLIEFYLFFK